MISIAHIEQMINDAVRANFHAPHPRRAAKIKELNQVRLSLLLNKDEQWFKSQYSLVSSEISIIKKNAKEAVENMGESIPLKERKKIYIEDSQLRHKQKQLMYLKLILDGDKKTPSRKRI